MSNKTNICGKSWEQVIPQEKAGYTNTELNDVIESSLQQKLPSLSGTCEAAAVDIRPGINSGALPERAAISLVFIPPSPLLVFFIVASSLASAKQIEAACSA